MIFRGFSALPISFRVLLPILTLGYVAEAGPARADVLTLRDGKTQQGIIIRNHPQEPRITIRTMAGEIAIPRDRITNVQTESPGASHVRLGNLYMEAGNANAAAEMYTKALELEPENADAAARMQQAEAALQARRQESMQVDEARIDETLAQVQALTKEKKFDQAAEALKALGMGYGTRKAADVRKAYADTYVAWAVDRLDRQDSATAAEKLQFALRLDPTNQTARQLLIRAYEGDPTKLKEVAEYYKDSANPEDQIRRADALFRLRQYEEALPIYQQYALDPKHGNQGMRDRIRLMFDMIHRQYADKGDYEGAYRWYTNFLQYSPNEDPVPLAKYEYMIQRKQTDMNDPAARAALAEFAEQRGMADTARKEYLNILTIAPEQPQAMAGVRRFAESDLEDARAFFQQGQYALALAKAQMIISTYPMMTEIAREAEQLRTKSNLEQGRVAQTRLQQGVALAERGDRYFEQALSYISALISTNVDRSMRVISPRQEAIKYLGWAIFSWQSALQIDPSLGDPATYDLYRKIADASAKYASLGNRSTPALPRVQGGKTQKIR